MLNDTTKQTFLHTDRNTAINDLGVFRIANNIHAGFDSNVNSENKMQILWTNLLTNPTTHNPLLLPFEVGELVGTQSLHKAKCGMGTLMDIGSQITSAVLGMDETSKNKLLDDCSTTTSAADVSSCMDDMTSNNADEIAENVSNSYQRIIRYLKPMSATNEGAAFLPHVDTTFLTLIPMPEIAGLEVWCPSSKYGESHNLAERGEWVRPLKPVHEESEYNDINCNHEDDQDSLHVVAMAGEFLQLLSNGQVPSCIHRVIAPNPPSPSKYGLTQQKYRPRVSAPLFLRPRRGEDAILDVEKDLRTSGDEGLYFEKNLLKECDSMRVWDYLNCIGPNDPVG